MPLKYHDNDNDNDDAIRIAQLREILELLDSFTRMSDVHLQKIAQVTGLSELEVMILREIQMNYTLTQTMIINNINLSSCRIKAALDSLIEKQLIEKVCDDCDEGAWAFGLSEDGDMLLVSSAVIKEKLSERFAHLPLSEQMQILIDLNLIAEMMQV